ncbi:hypothetical protein P8C59_009346 [Phyllachora maydis]|uniref:Uncharacterized protein n=1 Tax=Phyllachora maydis TaxID=1825666 RepID=A0AAD9ICF4_9PEZI|nr:hypothetical protein P8C59_009346 [Phyllachora maydis]
MNLSSLIHTPSVSWDKYCESVAASLLQTVENHGFRRDALSAIPTTSPRLVELRRRLALVFVFEDLPRASAHPEASFSLRAVMDKLDHDKAFVVNRQTNYNDFKALVGMLVIAIDDGVPPVSPDGTQARKDFNAEVDELAMKIRRLWNRIPDPGGQKLGTGPGSKN